MSDRQQQQHGEPRLAREGGRDKERGGAGKAAKQRKRNRSGSNSSNSSSSGSRSSGGSGERNNRDRAGRAVGKSKGKSHYNNRSTAVSSPYRENQSRPSGQREQKSATRVSRDGRKPVNDKSLVENGTRSSKNNYNNNTKNTNSNGSVENGNSSGDKYRSSNVNTPRDNNNNNNNNNNSNNNHHRPCTTTTRPRTSPTRGAASWDQSRGYDNSERNPDRRNLGSSTDQVADQRPIFGAWRAPDPDTQRLLVERLAPARPPAPPDPRFNHWKNHFLYYWHIGVDVKPRREGNYKGSPRVSGHCEVGRTSAHSHNGYDHRLLKRPKTSSGIMMRDNHNNNHSNSNHANHDLSNHPFTGNASISGRPLKSQRGSLSAREYGPEEIVAGLDRRYMGLQAVSSTEMQDIVQRLTKLTSAYNAKFAPNPHVWVDTEPGAHMVKRSNTTFN